MYRANTRLELNKGFSQIWMNSQENFVSVFLNLIKLNVIPNISLAATSTIHKD